MRLYCPECFENLHINHILQVAGYVTKKPLYCSNCNKSYTYDESKKTEGA